MTFFCHCLKWPLELWTRTQRSDDLILDEMGNPAQYLKQQPLFLMNYSMICSKAVFEYVLLIIAYILRGAHIA